MIAGGRARRAAAARRHDRRGDLGQHGRRPRDGRGAARLPLRVRDARQDVAREDRAAARVRRRGRGLPDRGRAGGSALVLLRLGAPRGGDAGRVQPEPVRQRGQPAGALRQHGPRDLGAGRRRARRARRRRRHRRHGDGHRALSQGAQARHRRSSAPTPIGSIYSTPEPHSYLVEGVGEDFWPTTFDRDIVDRWIRVSDREAFATTRRLARLEGILIGASGGMALHAALRVAQELPPDKTVLVILPDGGRAVPLEGLQRRLDARARHVRRRRAPADRGRARGRAHRRRARARERRARSSPSPMRSRCCSATPSRSCP